MKAGQVGAAETGHGAGRWSVWSLWDHEMSALRRGGHQPHPAIVYGGGNGSPEGLAAAEPEPEPSFPDFPLGALFSLLLPELSRPPVSCCPHRLIASCPWDCRPIRLPATPGFPDRSSPQRRACRHVRVSRGRGPVPFPALFRGAAWRWRT